MITKTKTVTTRTATATFTTTAQATYALMRLDVSACCRSISSSSPLLELEISFPAVPRSCSHLRLLRYQQSVSKSISSSHSLSYFSGCFCPCCFCCSCLVLSPGFNPPSFFFVILLSSCSRGAPSLSSWWDVDVAELLSSLVSVPWALLHRRCYLAVILLILTVGVFASTLAI